MIWGMSWVKAGLKGSFLAAGLIAAAPYFLHGEQEPSPSVSPPAASSEDIYVVQPGEGRWQVADKCTDTLPEFTLVYEGLRQFTDTNDQFQNGQHVNMSEFGDAATCPPPVP
jgi:hypothetical protein